jgi:hypothetical protein
MPKFNVDWPLNYQTLYGFDTSKGEFTQNPLLNLQSLKSTEDLTMRLSTTPMALWENFETEKEIFLKFLIPFEINATSTIIKADSKEINSHLLRDDSASSKLEFFFIGINPQHEDNGQPSINDLEIRNLEMSQLYNETDSSRLSDFNLNVKKQHLLLSRSNPNSFSYYFVVKQDELFFAPSSSSESIEVFTVPRYLVLSSRYPLSFFFQQILVKMTSFLRQFQLESYMSSLNQVVPMSRRPSAQSLSMMTSSLRSRETMVNIFSQMTNMCTNLLDSNPFVLFDKPLSLELPRFSVHYTLPEVKLAYLLEAGSSFLHTLSHLHFEDFILILFSHIFEKKIVFVSENNHSLSSAVATFTALIRPFRWTFPVIYNLPEDCLPILQSPIPVQIGLKSSAKKFLSEIIPRYFGDFRSQTETLFVLLDESIVLTSTAQVNSVPLPFFDDFLVILQVLYKKHFNPKGSNYLKISKKKSKNNLRKYSFSRQNKYSFKEKISKLKKKKISKKEKKKRNEKHQKENLQYSDSQNKEIFSYFWNIFNKAIISKLPSLNSLSQSQSHESDMCYGELKPENFSSNPFDQVFLKRFFSTQMFKFYLEHQFLGKNI